MIVVITVTQKSHLLYRQQTKEDGINSYVDGAVGGDNDLILMIGE